MHEINISSEKVRTDLIVEQKKRYANRKIRREKGLKIEEMMNGKEHYTTIYFEDITDMNHFEVVLSVFVQEIQKYLKKREKSRYLVIGLGNRESTPDSLGPKAIDNVLVTRYLFLLGEVEDGYGNVATFVPNVMGNTGIETTDIIKSILKQVEVDQVILIDALKTNHLERLGKTIQITNQGIAPGSGIGNIRKEISSTILDLDVVAIGIPTVVDLRSFLSNQKNLSENFMVTPTNIDFLIEKLALLVGDGLNLSLHKKVIRQKNY